MLSKGEYEGGPRGKLITMKMKCIILLGGQKQLEPKIHDALNNRNCFGRWIHVSKQRDSEGCV